ncbi:MAG: hypothetical protein COA38_20350 [Fluviicola sp.]|nr:MAG: hypothetical protein COA38_20350 [Fluviicola sp.]
MSGVLTELAVRQNTLVWVLEIDGLEESYHSAPSSVVLPAYTEAWTHTQQPGIQPGGITASSEELDVMKSVVTVGQVAVTIGVTRTNNAAQFMAVGRSGSPLVATLALTVDQVGAGFVTVNEDISAWPATGELWIGRECITYSARTVAAPFRFTIAVPSSRGWWGSEQRKHVASAIEGWAPRVYSQCVTWQSRKARVLVTSLRPDGTQAAGWVEYISGRIVSNPEVSEDGLSIAINIIPHTDALSINVGGGVSRTGLQQGVHTFDGKSGDQYLCSVGWDVGEAFDEEATFNAGAGIDLPIRYKSHEDTFDISSDPDKGRTGKLVEESSGSSFYVLTPSAAGYLGGPLGQAAGDKIVLTAAAAPFVSIGERWLNAAAWDELIGSPLTTPGAAEVVGWPDVAISRMSVALSPGTHLDVGPVDGQFADVAFNPNDNGAASITFLFNTNAKNAGTVQLTVWSESPLIMYYGVSGFDPDDNKRIWDLEGGEHERFGQSLIRSALATDSNGADFHALVPKATLPIRGYPDAYYQKGESFIHVQDDLFASTSAVLVRWTEWNGDEHLQSVRITGSEPASNVTVGAVGTLLKVDTELDRRNKSFGDWPGQARCTIEEDVSWSSETPGTILLNVLMSGDGDSFNSGFDVFASGANLTAEEVDVDSFLRYPYPDGLAQLLTLSLNTFDSITIRDFIEPILRSIGAALVVRVERVPTTGAGGVLRRRLALEVATSEYAPDALGTILNGDWVGAERPSTTDDNRIVNMLRLQMDYSSEDSEFDLIVNMSDRDSIGEYGPAPVDELDLRGIRMPQSSPADQVALLLPFTASRFSAVGAPRRVISGTISWADSVILNAGAVVIVDAVEVFDYDGDRGVAAVPMRIISIRPDGVHQKAQVKLTWHDATTSGWAPVLKVVAVGGAAIYTVKANEYTESDDPVTGLTLADIDFWNVGDSIRACPLGDFGNSTGGLTVLTIVGNIITLSAPAAPALVVGDTLRPDGFGVAATTVAQKLFAFLADDAATLGATPDPAKEYA